MRKLVMSLIVVYIVVALYSLTFDVDISMYNLLDSLKRANWYDFPTDELYDIVDEFKKVSFTSISWDDIIINWKLWKKMGNLVTSGFKIFKGLIDFSQESFKFIFMNMFEFIKVMTHFLRPNLS